MSLDDTLSKLITGDQDTPIDVAMRLLDPKDVVMHTNIKNVRTMNRLKFMIAYTEKTDPDEAEFWATLYEGALLHAVSEGRARSKEVVEIAKATAVNNLMNPPIESQGKRGLFGRR